ncbi:MAG TPA: ORF6N domain-containing protein [Spirochaetota bacterium]|nr:ORF6N domain-containing protein [Spirochaetota bacterium]HOD15976.1 ORF6N domain-containing protein [Spirochaetota bacterium]HPG51105.1 ORF6N domain-containing protein [Spirochaetota bacterium]HPN11006.1 ORF6N domain-containing protein [Spirochaetota bacterium]HQL82649.1 ORF6N domain-containing protein [Spirochaetota bacterium]
MKKIISLEMIVSRIHYIRGHKVMLDKDLAELYGVETRALNQAVIRNSARFPDDFMFQLTNDEFKILMSQIVISSWGGTRKYPHVFTEQGVAMLSSVLKSERAIQVNIQIMRTFTKIRQMISSHEDLQRKIEAMEEKYDEQFSVVFRAIRELIREDSVEKKKIGFE